MVEYYWGVRQVADRLGTSTQNISQPGAKLPKPDAWIGGTRGWKPETIEVWIPTRPGRGVGGGRPRKVRPVEVVG
jgi:hypothetical protein